MRNPVAQLGSQAMIYGLGYGLSRVVQFALLPVYTRYLTTEEYGILTLLLVTGSVAMVLMQAGMGSAMFREIILEGTDRRVVESTALLFLAAVAAFLFAAGYLLAPALSKAIFASADHTRVLRLVLLTAALSSGEAIVLARFRIEQRARLYAFLSFLRFLLGAGLAIYFLVILGRGVTGLVEATLITTAIFAVVYGVQLARGFRLAFSVSVLKRLLQFGGPLVPANVAGLSITSADRYILQHYSTVAVVGVYSLGYTIGQIINLAVNAIQLAWPAQMFTIAKKKDAERQLAGMVTYYFLFMGFLTLGISVFAREIVIIMTTPEFYSAARVVPWVCVAYLFYGISFMVNSGLTVRNKMKYSGMIATAVAVLNLGLCLWLIPRFGMMGAAWATLVAYALQLLALTVTNVRIWSIPYAYGRLATIALVAGLIYAGSQMIGYTGLWVPILVKTVLVLLYPTTLYLAGFFKSADMAALSNRA